MYWDIQIHDALKWESPQKKVDTLSWNQSHNKKQRRRWAKVRVNNFKIEWNTENQNISLLLFFLNPGYTFTSIQADSQLISMCINNV